jgi:hypothetical protein
VIHSRDGDVCMATKKKGAKRKVAKKATKKKGAKKKKR